jgi:hypothetical protein
VVAKVGLYLIVAELKAAPHLLKIIRNLTPSIPAVLQQARTGGMTQRFIRPEEQHLKLKMDGIFLCKLKYCGFFHQYLNNE